MTEIELNSLSDEELEAQVKKERDFCPQYAEHIVKGMM